MSGIGSSVSEESRAIDLIHMQRRAGDREVIRDGWDPRTGQSTHNRGRNMLTAVRSVYLHFG